MTILDYEKLFTDLNKKEIFELNKPFIEEVCRIKSRIDALNEMIGDNYILVHPEYPSRVKVNELSVHLMKLENQYKDMILALNKILGNIAGEETDPMEEWLNEHRNRSTEGND